MTLSLPFPAPELFPNNKSHWSVKGKARKIIREISKAEASQDIPYFHDDEYTGLSFTFYPPQR